MRTFDIPYIKNPSIPTSTPVDIDSLDLKTLTKTYLCGKSHGRVSECLRCPAPCAYGKRALELANPMSKAVNPPPLVDGKTMLERAREEVRKQRAEKEKAAEVEQSGTEKQKEIKDSTQRIENWYEKAKESGDPLKWVMETFGINERKAKQKFYNFWVSHPEKKEQIWEPRQKQKAVQESKADEEESAQEEKVSTPEPDLLGPLEDKINKLMNLQEEYKKKAEEYQKLYQETKAKVDALYEALNILNE